MFLLGFLLQRVLSGGINTGKHTLKRCRNGFLILAITLVFSSSEIRTLDGVYGCLRVFMGVLNTV
jgi:hypothetical protein